MTALQKLVLKETVQDIEKVQEMLDTQNAPEDLRRPSVNQYFELINNKLGTIATRLEIVSKDKK